MRVFSKALRWSCEKLPMTCALCFRVDKCNNLIKMQISLSRKKTADTNCQQRMPKPLTYRSNSTCNLDNLTRGSLKLLLLLLSFHKTTAVHYRVVPISSAAYPCFCMGTCSHQFQNVRYSNLVNCILINCFHHVLNQIMDKEICLTAS